jgi:hypothetical protein
METMSHDALARGFYDLDAAFMGALFLAGSL